MGVSNARSLAYKILNSDSMSARPVRDLIGRSNDERDVRFAEKLVNGVRAYKPMLDMAIDRNCVRGTKISLKLRICLEISAYELLYLEKEPHIAVNEGVELVKRVKKPASGLANVVLKKVATEKLKCFPRHLQHGFSNEVYEILISELGEKNANSFMEMSDLQPKSDCIDGIYANISSVEIARSVSDLLANANTFLEVGAGRGTKTALIQHFLNKDTVNNMRYDILEASEPKVAELKTRASLRNLKIDNYYCADASEFLSKNAYDVVFVDAPCSGLGTIRKHREIRWRTHKSDIDSLHDLNVSILQNISKCVSRCGSLIYSTCTITNSENMDVIDKFLNSKEGANFSLATILRNPNLTDIQDAHFCVELRRS